jgi:lipid II:glycine glycyltransferase (peptidoglycan interpeptide bridge formation enzyme)
MLSLNDWDAFVSSHHPATTHLLQTAPWGRLKSAFGWRAECLRVENAGCLLLFRPLPFGFSVGYLPRGPVPSTPAALADLLPSIDRICRSRRAAFLSIEPDWTDGAPAREPLQRLGFEPGARTIQPPRTILVDLQGSEDNLLARMKPKTRYNIRLAARHDVAVSSSGDIPAFARLMDATGLRDSFAVHSEKYYSAAYAGFTPHQTVELLIAHYRGEPVSGLMAFAQGTRAWYLYGASSNLHREVMAPYLLQWEAMRWARGRGCVEYDLWGVPDAGEDELEAQFADRQDGLWGVYRFKRGFGGRVRRSVGTWDRVYNPPLYRVYRMLTGRRKGNPA